MRGTNFESRAGLRAPPFTVGKREQAGAPTSAVTMQSDLGPMRFPPTVTLVRPRLRQCLRTHQTVNTLGDCRRFLPLLGGEGRGEGELYPNSNDTASVRSNSRIRNGLGFDSRLRIFESWCGL